MLKTFFLNDCRSLVVLVSPYTLKMFKGLYKIGTPPHVVFVRGELNIRREINVSIKKVACLYKNSNFALSWSRDLFV